MYGSHCTISSHLPGCESALNVVFWCVFLMNMAQCNTLWTGRCPQKLLSSSIHNQTRFCNNSEAMGGSSLDIPPPTTLFRLRMEDPNSVVWVFFLVGGSPVSGTQFNLAKSLFFCHNYDLIGLTKICWKSRKFFSPEVSRFGGAFNADFR